MSGGGLRVGMFGRTEDVGRGTMEWKEAGLETEVITAGWEPINEQKLEAG